MSLELAKTCIELRFLPITHSVVMSLPTLPLPVPRAGSLAGPGNSRRRSVSVARSLRLLWRSRLSHCQNSGLAFLPRCSLIDFPLVETVVLSQASTVFLLFPSPSVCFDNIYIFFLPALSNFSIIGPCHCLIRPYHFYPTSFCFPFAYMDQVKQSVKWKQGRGNKVFILPRIF